MTRKKSNVTDLGWERLMRELNTPPKVGLAEAVRIAVEYRTADGVRDRRCHPFQASDTQPQGFIRRGDWGPCWYVWFPSIAGLGLVSSHVVVVSQASGEVVDEGSAGDEG